jgi:hypothetical protein
MGRTMVTISAIWDRTTEFLSDTMSAVAPIALAGLFLPYAISTAIGPLATSDAEAKIIVSLCKIVLALWMMGGSLAIIALALRKPADRNSTMSAALARFLPMLGVALLLGIVFAVLFLPVVIALHASGFDFRAAAAGVQQTPKGGWVAFAGLYMIAFLVIVCWVSGRLMPLYAVVVAERRGIGAIGRAFALTRGMGGRLFGVMLLYGIVSGVAQLAARTVFGSIFTLIFGRGDQISAASVLTAVLVAAVGTIFFVLAAVFGAHLYLATRDTPAPVDVAPE